MPLLALGHRMALNLLTLMLGGALAPKPRASKIKRDATAMIRSLTFGFCLCALDTTIMFTLQLSSVV